MKRKRNKQLDFFIKPKKKKRKKRIISAKSKKEILRMKRSVSYIREWNSGKLWKSVQGNWCFYLYENK